ncbi:hypothetical protein [Phormidesmis priestleyi]|nr:hypothetical protein [Phormidesmis priestleyi]
MTEFHQKKEQGRSVDPPVNSVQETLGGNAENNIRKAIPPAKESSPANAEMNAEAVSSQVEEVPYERLQQGPITYFRYYFEGAEQPTYLDSPSTELPTNKRNLLPLYLAGGGVLGATLISGFVIAGLANNSKAPEQKGTSGSKVKQTPTPKLSQPQVAYPEVVPPSRSTPTKPPQTPKKAPTKKLPLPTVRSSSDPQLQQALMVPKPLPVPALPIVSVPIAQAFSKPLPAPAIQPPTPPAIAPASEVSTALPSVKPALPVLVADSSPRPPDVSPSPAAQKPAPSQPTIADARCLSSAAAPGESLLAQNQQPIAAQSAMLVSPPESVGMLSANRQSQAEKPAVNSGTAISTTTAEGGAIQDAEKDLQELLELPQRFPTSAGIAVMPLPCQLAQTATTKQRVADFNVIRLSPQDYQNRWKLSSKNPQALIPIYGFVDYKQQSVVLLSARPEQTSKL